MTLTVVYIISPGHSGSTLLDLLLASHSQVATIGEAKVLSPSRPQPGVNNTCTCGARGLHQCAFWEAVDERLRRNHGLSLDTLDVDATDSATFARHNLGLFDSVAEVCGRRVIVDSSKSPERLERLLQLDGIVVRPVQLRRDPRGVVYSNVKKGRSWIRYAIAYGRHYARADRVLQGHSVYGVRYEQLTSDPAGVIAGVMTWLGLAFEPDQLAWKARTHHSVAGNHMRMKPAGEIRVDEQWKDTLSLVQQFGTTMLSRAGGFLPPLGLSRVQAALRNRGR